MGLRKDGTGVDEHMHASSAGQYADAAIQPSRHMVNQLAMFMQLHTHLFDTCEEQGHEAQCKQFLLHSL